MYCIASPFSKTFDDIGLIYSIPNFLEWKIKVWNIVEVPIKSTIEVAVVLDIVTKVSIDDSKIKSIISLKNSHIHLQSYQVELLKWISQHYFSAIHIPLISFSQKT